MRIPDRDDRGVPVAFVPSAKAGRGGDREDTTWRGRGVLGRPTMTKGLSFTIGEELSIVPMGVPREGPLVLLMLPNEPAALLCRMVTGGGARGT